MRAQGCLSTRFWGCWRDRRGVATIEFAFIAAAFIVSILGIIEFCRAFWIRSSLQQAADETAHYAMIHTAATQDELVAYAKQAATGLDPNDVAVTVTWDTSGGTSFVTVATGYSDTLAVPFLTNATIGLAGRARVPQIY